ncbi:MAG: pilus (MSHA type) biogenesis protein MshL [Gammaproteobacteria bacterium]|nr:pilus (MSHA type) biogenesis protein MshL [Gammaproteobacteria bacterium]
MDRDRAEHSHYPIPGLTSFPLVVTAAVAILLMAGCAQVAPTAAPTPDVHLQVATSPAPASIPDVVTEMAPLPAPTPAPAAEHYTVVVNEVPVRELLFALARDAQMNVDINGGVEGSVTLNAVDQTLPQILERISRQVAIRYGVENGTIVVEPDLPFIRVYRIDYVNVARDSTQEVQVATQIQSTVDGGGASSGLNNSRTDIRTTSNNRFWRTLTTNVLSLLGVDVSNTAGSTTDLPLSDLVVANPETGLLSVRATARQHAEIQHFIDQVMDSAQRQVLIEATIVEVELNDQFQAGIDWQMMRQAGDTGVSSTLNLAAPELVNDLSSLVLRYDNPAAGGLSIAATVNLLKQFGDTQVLSSPRIMALNNQTAVLKVAENRVYFTIQADVAQSQVNSLTTFTTTPHTVPVGFVMNVTPQISESDVVLLNVRPTISRIVGFVNDPNPDLKRDVTEPIVSQVPEIAVREFESVLRVNNGQIAVLGGLIQDSIEQNTRGIPLLSDIPLLGETVFGGRANNTVKTELVVFLRPVIVRNPSLDEDLRDYRPLLERRTSLR